MNIALRPASLIDDREQMLELLERNFPGLTTNFRLRHEGNPAGPGWSWVLYDRQSGAIGAMTSVFPRRMYLDGRPILCGQVGEFVVDVTYRSLGPAVMLQRATFQPVDSGELTLCYDCPPHDRGMATFVRLGMRPSCDVTRYALPLRSDEVFEKRLGKGAWTKPLIASANLLLSLRKRNHRNAGLEISRFDGIFGDEFSELDKKVSSSGTLRANRSADLLNWRYHKNPELRIEMLVARRKGELLAFLACGVFNDNRAVVYDLFGLELQEVGLALLYAAIEMCRRENVVCLQGYCSDTSALKPLFEAAGFRARERAARVVAYTRSEDQAGRFLNSSLPWRLGQAEVGV
jgi:hypothetical protein